MRTLQEAINIYKSFVGKTRAQLEDPKTGAPWLKGKPHNYFDCASGFSYASGIGRDIYSCGIWVQHFKNEHTWKTTGLPKRGDAVIFSWDGKGMREDGGEHDHIGLCAVDAVAGKPIQYLSADSGDQRIVNLHSVDLKFVSGYATIPWATEATK